MDIRVNDDTIPKKTVNMKLKRKYAQGRLTSRWEQYARKGDRLGCQAANTKVETTKTWAVRLSKLLM
jgi:hypothetical protein